ncbi:MAG: hypothetical protein WBO68_09500 [Pyrinomonadaceae bacterium]
MTETDIKFEREGVEGVVPAGTYLIDAMKRLGVAKFDPCDRTKGIHNCRVAVAAGISLLSELTATETEHFASNGRRTNERLACETKVERPGEIIIMTQEAKTEAAKKPVKDKFQAEFEALPLEEKISKLFKMEAVTIGETINYVMESPMEVFSKIGDVMAGFGRKIEEEAKKATRPAEHVKPEAASKPPRSRAAAKPGSTSSKAKKTDKE